MHDRELYRQILGIQAPWHVADGRGRETTDAWFAGQKRKMLANLHTVVMDMWSAYISSTLAHVPNAESKIVFDKFHVAKHLGDAVDQVRRTEHRLLLASTGESVLTRSRYLWLQHPDLMADGA